MKGFALGLVLKQRRNATQKWAVGLVLEIFTRQKRGAL